jgi:benzoylformate decarboxylase
MIGRDVVYQYLHDLGVNYLFGVPGTNEIPIIDGTNVPEYGVDYIPCLHENIAMGAAMGYARASGKPGVVELHVTPGAAHGIGNLFNAYKAGIPIVVLCAQQHSELLLQEPILASDLVQTVRQYTKWAHEVRFPGELPMALQRAFKEALTPPCKPVFLSIPWDFTIAPVVDESSIPPKVTQVGQRFLGDPDEVTRAAGLLAKAKSPIVVVGDGAGAADAWPELERLAVMLGAPVRGEALQSYMNFPNRSPNWQGELPQLQSQLQAMFKDNDVAFLCGYNAQAQVLVFDYEDGPLIPASVTQIYLNNDPWQIGKNGYGEAAILGDVKATLPSLCSAIEADPAYDSAAAAERQEKLHGVAQDFRASVDAYASELAAQSGDALPTATDIATTLEKLRPKMKAPLMLSNEAVSDIPAFQTNLTYDEPKSYFFGVGGSLGFSMPAALGMKLATGDERTIVNVVGDGSALFYPHTWWTATKFDIPVLFVITNNREYHTLQLGLQGLDKVLGWTPAGDAWYLRLDNPEMSFVALAKTFGIKGTIVKSRKGLRDGLRKGLAAVSGGKSYVVEVLTDRDMPKTTAARPAYARTAGKEEKGDSIRAGLAHLGPA